MARGRPPKPIERIRATARDATHKADGRALATTQYKLERRHQIPVAPDSLGDRGATEWEKIWLAGYWLSDEQDYHWVAIVARAYDDLEAFRERVSVDGLVQTGMRGEPVAHPLIAEARRAEAVIMKALSTIGFSPTDRARLGLAEVKRQSALADLSAKMKSK